MHYFVACLLSHIATLLYIVSMTECTNHRLWDTETLSHKILHDEYYEKWDTIDKTKHRLSMPQPRIWQHESRQNFVMSKKKGHHNSDQAFLTSILRNQNADLFFTFRYVL